MNDALAWSIFAVVVLVGFYWLCRLLYIAGLGVIEMLVALHRKCRK